MTHRLIAFWILGAVFLTAGASVAGSPELASDPFYRFMSILAAFVLFMLAGLCWTSVSVGTVKRH